MFIDNLKQIRYRIAAAARRTNRDPEAIRLVAVTKYASLDLVRAALESGLITEVGENRVQEAEKKKLALGELAGRVRWRLIGPLQSNKAKKAVAVFDAIDTIANVGTAEAVSKALGERILPILVQVKLTDRETQSGVAAADLSALLAALKNYPRLKVEGLMGIAPNVPLEETRPGFRALRELRDRLLPGGLLSMGMSGDFEVAIEEGADLVRIGSQIFPQRSPASLEAPA